MCENLNNSDYLEYKGNRCCSEMLSFKYALYKYNKENNYPTYRNVKSKCEMFEMSEMSEISEKINKINMINKNLFLQNNIKCNHEYIEHFKNDNTCSMDIGGTLTKIVYVNEKCSYEENEIINDYNSEIKIGENKYLFLKYFKLQELENAVDFLIKKKLIKKKLVITGGGSYKHFYTVLERLLWSKLFSNNKKEILLSSQSNKTSFTGLDDKEQTSVPIICISKKEYCEESQICHIYIYVSENKHVQIDKVLNKQFIDTIDCKTVRFYLNKEKYYSQQQSREKEVVKSKYVIKSEEEKKSKNKRDNGLEESEDELLLELSKKDEMQSIIKGIHVLFSVTNSIVNYNFYLEAEIFAKLKFPLESFLLVNIGSGISILKCDHSGEFKRIMGTAVGGGTFMGLSQLILGKVDFAELIKLAEKGKNNFDLKVWNWKSLKKKKKIYDSLFLLGSFGLFNKFFSTKKKRKSAYENAEIRHNIAKSLIQMISFTIAQLAYLLAVAHNVRRIFFSGTYVHNCELIMKLITYGICYAHEHYLSNKKTWNTDISKSILRKDEFSFMYKNRILREEEQMNKSVEPFGTCSFCDKNSNVEDIIEEDIIPEVFFLKHDGYVGALGCFFL